MSHWWELRYHTKNRKIKSVYWPEKTAPSPICSPLQPSSYTQLPWCWLEIGELSAGSLSSPEKNIKRYWHLLLPPPLLQVKITSHHQIFSTALPNRKGKVRTTRHLQQFFNMKGKEQNKQGGKKGLRINRDNAKNEENILNTIINHIPKKIKDNIESVK